MTIKHCYYVFRTSILAAVALLSNACRLLVGESCETFIHVDHKQLQFL